MIERADKIKGNYYQQKFALEINYLLKSLTDKYELLNEKEVSLSELLNEKTRQEVADILGIGAPKLLAQLQYMDFLNLYDGTKETLFAKKILKMKNNSDYVDPLLYYFLTRNSYSGGHYLYSEIINEIIFKVFSENFEYKINYSDILQKTKELNIDNLDEKSWNSMIRFTINCLTQSEIGLGKMGLLEEIGEDKKNPVYEIHSYWVEPLVGAYIIYDLWKDGQTAMPINSIVNDKYNLGRIFLMDQDAIMETLEEIKALGLIDIDLTAGLNQIRKGSRYSKEDILDMMIENS
ncbi:MAG: DUF4007 family protein [Cetobacterium sp.]